MYIIDQTIRNAITLLRDNIIPEVYVNTSSDYREISKLPAIILDSFEITKNGTLSTSAPLILDKDVPNLTYKLIKGYRQVVDLKFAVLIIATKQRQVLKLSEQLMKYILQLGCIEMDDPDLGIAYEFLTLLDDPVGISRWKPNDSNLKLIEHSLTIRGLPILQGIEEGHLVETINIQYADMEGNPIDDPEIRKLT